MPNPFQPPQSSEPLGFDPTYRYRPIRVLTVVVAVAFGLDVLCFWRARPARRGYKAMTQPSSKERSPGTSRAVSSPSVSF